MADKYAPNYRTNRLPTEIDRVRNFGILANKQAKLISEVRNDFPDTPIPNKIAVLKKIKPIAEIYQPARLKIGKRISDSYNGKKGLS